MREIGALVDLRRGRDEVALRDVADQDDVEEAVVGPCARARATSLRRATGRSRRSRRACGPRDACRRRAAPSRSCSSTRRRRASARRRTSPCRRAPSTCRSRAARRRRSCRRCRRSRSSALLRAAPLAVRHAADVDRARHARERRLRTASSKRVGIPYVRPKSMPVPSGIVASSAAVAGAHEAVDDLVQRAVAADRDDELGAVARRALGELDQMARPLGEERLAGEAELRGAVRELRPALPGDAVVGRRVDEEDGANAESEVTVASRRASSGRPRRAARRR